MESTSKKPSLQKSINSQLVKREDLDVEMWNKFVQNSPQGSIYNYTWFLDIVCINWCAIVVKNGEKWVAILPINYNRKFGLEYALQPMLTQFMGVILSNEVDNSGRMFESEKTIIKSLISKIPEKYKVFDFNFHPNSTYILPFHWAGYKLTSKYTYWLHVPESTESLKNRFSKSIKQDLKHAAKEGLQYSESENIDELSAFLVAKSLRSTSEVVVLKKLWNEIIKQKIGFIAQVKDSQGNTICAAAILKDGDKLVYFLCCSSTKSKKGANSFLILSVVEKITQMEGVNYFDFEGSMIESIEHYFRGFSPEQKAYQNINRSTLSAGAQFLYALKKQVFGK